MKIIIYTLSLIAFLSLVNCKSNSVNPSKKEISSEITQENNINKNNISQISPSSNRRFKQGETIKISFESEKEPDSAILYVNNKRNGALVSKTIDLITDKNTPVGSTSLRIEGFFSGDKSTKSSYITILPQESPQRYTIKKVKEFPHSTGSYTQGLEFYDSKLYESSGEYDKSFIEILSFPDLKQQKRFNLDNKYFAEGITILNDKLYLLTWREKKGFVFDAKTLTKEKEFEYNREGWGITNDGKQLYMSDGSQYIYIIDPTTLTQTGKIEVWSDTRAMSLINEMEWIDGKIWANRYEYNDIIIINPATGAVEGTVDASSLVLDIKMTDQTDVLNGIAYNNGKIYLTGKNWNKLFEVAIIKR